MNPEFPPKEVQQILKNLPSNPGIYKMKNSEGIVLYIGKAKNLKNRVRSYFQKNKDHTIKTRKMVEQINDIEYIIVDSELEALILETNLIKQLRPKYNILMKDDKNYVYIKITTQEDYPRISIVRQIQKDKAKYFGPKTSGHQAKQTLKALKKIFPYRHCNLNIQYLPEAKIDPENKQSLRKRVILSNISIKIPCLDYHIKRCNAPCLGIPTPTEYKQLINQIIRFLEGKTEEVLNTLKTQMITAATNKKFELAARIRDKLMVIEGICEKQKVSDPNQKNTDIINFYIAEDHAFFNIFLIRDGKLIEQENFTFKIPAETIPTPNPGELFDSSENTEFATEILENFLQQYYERAADIGKEILIPNTINNQKVFEDYLSNLKESRVKIIVPQKGKKNQLLQLALKNAEAYAKKQQISWQSNKPPLKETLTNLKKALLMDKTPKRIECYDISHFSGYDTVASMVVFENGKPKNKDYRQFKIKSLPKLGVDDYASLKETLTRRLRYISKKKSLPNNTTIQRTKKKELPTLQEIIKSLNTKKQETSKLEKLYKEFFLISESEKATSYIRLQPIPTSKTEFIELISGPNLNPSFVTHLLGKTKTNRVYIQASKQQELQFTEAGFRIIYKLPKSLQEFENSESIFMVYDKKNSTDHSFKKKPDLIIIDGGKGQLSTIVSVLQELELEQTIHLTSIAKQEEEIFIHQPASHEHPEPRTAIAALAKNSPAQKLIQSCRDEAHRFANEYRKKLQSKALTQSELNQIPGVGPKIRTNLLKKFKSISAIKAASIEEITPLCGPKLAARIINHLKP